MAKRGRRYVESNRLIDPTEEYSPEEAVRLVKEAAYANFDETVESHFRLGVDPRHADQQVRGIVALPHGTGQETKVLVFAQGEPAKLAEEAGADYVGGDDLVERIEGGWLDFDAVVAIPRMMGKVGPLGRILGPRGMMPNPKAGTIVQPEDLPRTIEALKAGRIEFRIDKTSNLHILIGKVSFSEEELLENLAAAVDAVVVNRPPGARGRYIQKLYLASTMGPSVKISVSGALDLQAA